MEVILIYAQGSNGAFGKGNKMPWHVQADLAHFQRVTKGHAVVMGRNTWNSLPPKARPLPDRVNLVITKNEFMEEAKPVTSLKEAIRAAKSAKKQKLFVIGGPALLEAAECIAHRIIISRIEYNGDYDVKAPSIDFHKWKLDDCAMVVPVRFTEKPFGIDQFIPAEEHRRYKNTPLRRLFNKLDL